MGAALNVACAGGEPLALTDCLNFGNPERPEIAWELAAAIDGIAQAAQRARHPGRLRQRLALQRDRRPADPAHTGRRLRRARRRPRAGPVRAGAARRAPGVAARARAPSSSLRLAERSAVQPRPRRRRRTARAALREAGSWSGRRGRPRAAPTGRASSSRCAPATSEPLACATARSSSGVRLMCGVFGSPRARPRRRPAHLLRPLRTAASRPGVGRHRRLRYPRARSPACATSASSRRSSTSRSCRDCAASSRSGTPATRRRARTRGRTPSRSSTTARPHGRARPQRQPDERRRAP